MAKRTSSFRSLGIRNLKSSGNSVVKFTGNAASKATVGVFRYMATDHLGMADSLSRMPKMGAFDSLKYILMQFVIRVFAIAVVGAILLILIVFLGQL